MLENNLAALRIFFMECTLCGKNLSEEERVCAYCNPLEMTEGKQDEVCRQVFRLMRKSKAWVLVGFAVFPGWLSHPISYWFAAKALQLYDETQLDNPTVKLKILRLRAIAGSLSLLYWICTIVWIVDIIKNQ